jgi:hypothetical protein
MEPSVASVEMTFSFFLRRSSTLARICNFAWTYDFAWIFDSAWIFDFGRIIDFGWIIGTRGSKGKRNGPRLTAPRPFG